MTWKSSSYKFTYEFDIIDDMMNQALATTLRVTAPRLISYDVTHVTGHVFDVDDRTLANLCGCRQTLLVVDQKVFSIYGAAIQQYANERLDCISIVLLDGLEAHKSWDQVARVCSEALRCGLRRDGVIVAVGGGVTLDVTGVAAALYRRGVRFVRIPTTLVGLIDVCVGIKHGINFGSKKNALGAFYPPFGGINDLTFLRTLSRRELACGIAEIVKIAVVGDSALFDLLELQIEALVENNFQAPQTEAKNIVVRAELAMIDQLQSNLFEHDLHRLVDFGHTFSPVLEARSNYELAHGEAVAVDMLISTAIAEQRSICDRSVLDRIMHVCRQADLPWSHPTATPAIMVEALAEARAHRAGDLNLVVPTSIGEGTFLQDVDSAEIERALRCVESRAMTTGVGLTIAGNRD